VIGFCETSRCFAMASSIASIDGWNSSATSVLCKKNMSFILCNESMSDSIDTHPGIFIWPERMSTEGSLSRAVPNLMYEGSPEFRKVNFVVLSKQRVIWSTSSLYLEPRSFPDVKKKREVPTAY
jgi:hypothetical protein